MKHTAPCRWIPLVLLIAAGACSRGGDAPAPGQGKDHLAELQGGLSPREVLDKLNDAKAEKTRLAIKLSLQGLDMYRVQNGAYPTEAQGLRVLVDQKILRAMPKDAWDRDLIYSLPAPDRPKLRSLGSDGQPGGQGAAADVEDGY